MEGSAQVKARAGLALKNRKRKGAAGMTREEWVQYCLSFADVYEDHPFDKVDTGPTESWTLFRHRRNQKAFVFLYERENKNFANLKCDPLFADLLRGTYSQVTAGYHMNKTHWITTPLDGSVPQDEIKAWIAQSYQLTAPKPDKRRKPV